MLRFPCGYRPRAVAASRCRASPRTRCPAPGVAQASGPQRMGPCAGGVRSVGSRRTSFAGACCGAAGGVGEDPQLYGPDSPPPLYQDPKDKGDWPIPLEISCDGRSEYYVVGEIHDCHDTRQVKVTVKGPHASHVWLRVVSGAWLHSKATKYSKTSVTFTTGSGNPNCRPGYPIEVVDIGGRVAGSVGNKHFLEDHQHARGNSQYVTVRHICR